MLILGLFAARASAAGLSYEFSPALSLTGNCVVSGVDPIPDPSCPYDPAGPPKAPSGRFAEPRSVAIDLYGNEYVASYASNGKAGRIDVFDDEGKFITEVADPNGPLSIAVDSKGNLYAFEYLLGGGGEAQVARYSPTVYKPALGEIEYGNPRAVVATEPVTILGGIAVDTSTDRLFVAPAGAYINEYASAEAGNGLIKTITHPKLNWTSWVAVDAERRRLYASYCKQSIVECGILVFDADAPHELLKELDGSNVPAGEFRSEKGWLSIAVDEETGHFFVDDLEQTKNIYEFDEDYDLFATTTHKRLEGGNALQIAYSNSPLNPAAVNRRHLFVPAPVGNVVNAFNPPAEIPPTVEDLAVANVSEREAELHATVDPGGGETTYQFQYVSEAQFAESEWIDAKSTAVGTIRKGASTTSVVAAVNDLSPGTGYRFRAVAANQAGAEPNPPEATFSTYFDAPTQPAAGCPNDSLRIGFSSSLPDCRAYELVTPADTNGRPPKGVGFVGERFPTLQASPLGNAVSFVTEGGSIPGTDGTGGFNGDLYRSSRGDSGWATVRTGPTGEETSIPSPGSPSPDQGHAFFTVAGEGTAVKNGQHSNYVRYPDGRAELIGRGSLGEDPGARGKLITEGGTHIIFQTESVLPFAAQQLEPNAPPTGTEVVYDRTQDEVTHVVSLLPGDVTPGAGKDATYLDASADGSAIAFSVFQDPGLYVRIDNAVTHDLGDNLELAEISSDGRRIFYVRAGDLFAFEVEDEEEIRFTETGDLSVVNVAPDGSRAYFASTTAIAGSGANPNGEVPQAGQQNLYLSEEGAIRFVGTVTARDVEGENSSSVGWVDGLGLWNEWQATQPARDPSRVDGDGSVLLFRSRANLDGYDSGGVPQIYRYDSGANRLHCISCIPTNASAGGGASLETYAIAQTTRPPFNLNGFVPNLRPDGRRAFFQSTEALVSWDTNEVQDVYQWEEQGVGSCTRPGGCVYLISSGHSHRDNYLFGVSRSGDDVFFITEDVLLPGDDDTASIYDARVGGGFAEAHAPACSGEGCRPALTAPPGLPAPAVPAIGAEDNVKPRACPRGKRKINRGGKVRCVKKRAKKKNRSSKKSRRQGRAPKGAGR